MCYREKHISEQKWFTIWTDLVANKLLTLDFSHALNMFNINQYLRYSSFALAVQTI